MIQFFKSIVVRILRAEAKAVIHRYKPKIILVTGSIGKTSTKDAVFAVLSKFYHVRKSEKSYNSEIGIPLSILGLETGWQNPFIWIKNFFSGALLLVRKNKAYPEWLVLEVGTRKPGDIKMSVGWLKADIVILTAIGTTPPHIEFYKSLQHLVEEKNIYPLLLEKEWYFDY
jgi:UDP-N-acetylmuramoyl-tripeptide--D-alanyl-D-alanine ligase